MGLKGGIICNLFVQKFQRRLYVFLSASLEIPRWSRVPTVPPKSGIHFLSLRTNRIQIGLLVKREGEEEDFSFKVFSGHWNLGAWLGSFDPL